ncbi:MAG: HEPN domain-containing protein [Armatimonadetes bacterium]|nr:HEPN domain-containing protein [Armatimonadota bacterium]
MTPENRHFNVGLEVKRAEDRFLQAEVLLERGMLEGAVSAAYYGAFHYARALLLMEGLESKTHGGVHHLINVHFVLPGRIAPEQAKSLRDLQRDREEAEYDAASVFNRPMAEEALRQARAFADTARTLLRDGGALEEPR